MDPFDLPHPLSIVMENIDPFKHSDLIEGRQSSFFLLVRERRKMGRGMVDEPVLSVDKVTLTACSLLAIMGTSGGIGNHE